MACTSNSTATPNDDGAALRYAVTPGYFDVMRIPLRRGRLLDAHDDGSAPRAVLINESFARRTFPGRKVLGRDSASDPKRATGTPSWGSSAT